MTIHSETLLYKSPQEVSSNTTAIIGKNYHFVGTHTLTLPETANLVAGSQIRFTKVDHIEPIIMVDNVSTEVIRINAVDREDTGIIFDLECEIILIWTGTRWEV